MRTKVFEYFEDEKGRKVTICTMQTEQGHIFRGRATCSPMDTYSEEVGMRLATQRAKQKQMAKIVRNLAKKRDEAEALHLSYGRKLYRALDKEDALYNEEV